MGPTDRIEHPTPITLGDGFSDSLTVHLPQLPPPTLEELLDDQLEHPHQNTLGNPASTARPVTLGPVDVTTTSDEVRRFFEN